MSRRTITLDDALHQYLLDVSLREPPILAELREDTSRLPNPGMQIAPEQGQFMRLLVSLIGARRILEVGTFTGYSSACMALGLPEDGQIVTCDVDAETTETARRYWREAGVAGRIDPRLGPALDTLDALIAEGQKGRFDFAFIDADKENYDGYYERCLTLVRQGGLIAVDNVLWHGKVVDLDKTDPGTEAIRALNAKIHADTRVEISLVPIGDGLTLARKV